MFGEARMNWELMRAEVFEVNKGQIIKIPMLGWSLFFSLKAMVNTGKDYKKERYGHIDL